MMDEHRRQDSAAPSRILPHVGFIDELTNVMLDLVTVLAGVAGFPPLSRAVVVNIENVVRQDGTERLTQRYTSDMPPAAAG